MSEPTDKRGYPQADHVHVWNEERGIYEYRPMSEPTDKRDAGVPFQITLRFQFADGYWWLQSDDLPGVMVTNPDPEKVLYDLIPMWKLFNELRPGQCPEIPE